MDREILMALRVPGDPSDPLGPQWLERLAVDITALGGHSVLVVLVVAVSGFLFLDARRGAAWLLLGSAIGATLLNTGLKYAFDRARPDVVAHLVNATSPSFPSGHALLSTAIYLTLGALLAREFPNPVLQRYFLSVAVVLALLIGLSRIYLGVHWPSDVMAGWIIGALWAYGCWTLDGRIASAHRR